jgi:hypothetical protein
MIPVECILFHSVLIIWESCLSVYMLHLFYLQIDLVTNTSVL